MFDEISPDTSSSMPSPPLLFHLLRNSCHLFSIHKSDSTLLISSVCSLDSTDEGCVAFVFPWLIALSATLSGSIHTAAKSKIPSFFVVE